MVVPKYKINGIHISKSQVPIFVILAGWVLVILSIALGFTAKMDTDPTATVNGTTVKVQGKNKVVLGVVLLSCGLLLIIAPYFNTVYYVTLQLSKPKSAAHGLAGLIAMFLPDPYTHSFRLVEMPDANKLMDYAYGNLAGNMDKMHALSHLIQDNISDIIKPNSLADVA